jgi:hypothetical protein
MSQAPTVDGPWPCYFTSLEDYTQILMLHAARIRRCRRNQPSPPCKQISGGVLVIPDSSLLTEASVTITRLAVTTDPAVPCLSHPSRQVWWCTQPPTALRAGGSLELGGGDPSESSAGTDQVVIRMEDSARKIPHGRSESRRRNFGRSLASCAAWHAPHNTPSCSWRC